jgi:hypothetical protein
MIVLPRLRILALLATGVACAGCRLDESGLGTAPILRRDAAPFEYPAVTPEGGADVVAAADGSGGGDDGAGAADAGPGADGGAGDGALTADGGGRTDAVGASDAIGGVDAIGSSDAIGGGDGGGAKDARDGGDGGGGCGPCQPCETCVAGACKVDPASQWLVVCASAQLSMTPPTGPGTTWDPKNGALGGTAPDPFCEFEMPAGAVTLATAGVTDTIVDSFTAMWGQTVSPAGKTVKASDLMSTTNTWRLWVGDDDGNGVGQVACQIQQPLSANALHTGQLTVQNLGSCVSLTVQFLCQP